MSNAELRELGRLPYPMLRERGDNGFRRISWDDAIARIAKRIRATDPTRLAFFLTSRGVTNEVYYMAQKVARFLGTNNVDNAARLCHSPSTGAMKHALGFAASTCSYKDWCGTDLIVFFGSNPANDQPVAMKYLAAGEDSSARRSCWSTRTASRAWSGTGCRRRRRAPCSARRSADYWFPVAQGGDIAFLYGVLKVLIENDWHDHEFVANHTRRLRRTRKQRVNELALGRARRAVGPARAHDMEEFAELIRDAKNAVFVWSMGITQHRFGGDAVQMILNLGLAQGYVGRDKCGLMPIRGHSGVQGGAEMGAYSTAFPGGKPINAENADALSKRTTASPSRTRPASPRPRWSRPARAASSICSTASAAISSARCPNPSTSRSAMANVPLRVHQDIILTDQMFIDAKRRSAAAPREDALRAGRRRHRDHHRTPHRPPFDRVSSTFRAPLSRPWFYCYTFHSVAR